MAATAYFCHTLRFDVFRVNPPLTRMVAGLPITLARPNHDWNYYSSRPQDRSESALGSAFISANSPEKVHWCFALARWSLIPLLLLGGYFGYRLSREIYGRAAGWVFLTLWSFSPLLLAWGATICPDATAAAVGVVAIYALRQWLYGPNWLRAAIAGVCLGLMPLAKLTWSIAFGIWPLIWLVWAVAGCWRGADNAVRPRPPLRQFAVLLLLGIYTLNMGYLFDGTGRRLGDYVFISQTFGGQRASEEQPFPVTANRFAGTWLASIPLPVPGEFVQGIDTQRYDFERGLPSYLRGEWSNHGWWYYYLYVLLLKMPLGTWCLMALAVFCALFQRGYNAAWRDEMLVLLPCVLLFLLVSSQTGFSAHPRYILPALPLLFVGISRVGRAFTLKRPVIGTLATLSLGYMVVSSMAIYPHSLSYFNELAVVLPTPADRSYPKHSDENGDGRSILSSIQYALTAGPRNGPRHLLGSNLDWGQDLFYLEDWYQLHSEARPIKVAYEGNYPLDRTKIESTGTPPAEPLPGWYALSVNEIYGQSQQYRYFLHFHPVAMAGYSIYIYHITPEEANRVRGESNLPKLPETSNAGRESS